MSKHLDLYFPNLFSKVPAGFRPRATIIQYNGMLCRGLTSPANYKILAANFPWAKAEAKKAYIDKGVPARISSQKRWLKATKKTTRKT